MIKLLFGGDLHKLPKDKTTIEGYADCTQAVQASLMDIIRQREIDYFVSLGDWYDKGYGGDTAASHADTDYDIEMSKLLNGKFYGLIGNHIRLRMDSNPELMLIQPHEYYRSRRRVKRTEQIIKTPEVLRIGDVQISFMHHNKDAEDCLPYKPTRQDWAKYHIALFHTLSVIPSARLMETGYSYGAVSNTKIGQTLEGVDLAIVGDCHKPLGQFQINTPTGVTTMIVPGSLTNTDASEINRHHVIMLPLISIDEESRVTLAYERFDLHTNLLTFKQKNVERNMEKLRSLQGKAVEKLHEDTPLTAVVEKGQNVYASLNLFMESQNYTSTDKTLVKSILKDPADLNKLVETYLSE